VCLSVYLSIRLCTNICLRLYMPSVKLSVNLSPSMYKHLSPFVHAQHLSIYLSV